jgi:hypothetical protein
MRQIDTGLDLHTLSAHGFTVREEWMGGYYDGLMATKKVGGHLVEVYTGGADNGEYSEPHYPAVVYVDGRRVASGLTVPKALRVAQFRCLMCSKNAE